MKYLGYVAVIALAFVSGAVLWSVIAFLASESEASGGSAVAAGVFSSCLVILQAFKKLRVRKE